MDNQHRESVRAQLIEIISRVLDGWRDFDKVHAMLPTRELTEGDSYLCKVSLELNSILCEDPRFWNEGFEEMIVDVTLLRWGDVPADVLLRCREKVMERMYGPTRDSKTHSSGLLQLNIGDLDRPDTIAALVDRCLSEIDQGKG